MSCDSSKTFAFAARLYQEKMKGTTMSTSAKNTTPKDVAAKAVEEKLVVPAQADEPNTGDKVSDKKDDQPETPELTVLEGGKRSLKDRFAEVTEKAKKNRKNLIAMGAAVGVAALVFVQYAKRKAEEALLEVVTEDGSDEQTTSDDSAA